MTDDEMTEDLAQRYTKSEQTGRAYIKTVWESLKPETRDYLISTLIFDERGSRLTPDEHTDFTNEIENLEVALGNLKLCAGYKLPARTESDAVIGYEAFQEDVLHACTEILFYKHRHDPVFLRLALQAIPIHQASKFMINLPPLKESNPIAKGIFTALFAVFVGILVVSSPYVLGVALTSAGSGNETPVVQALYFLGFTWLMASTLKNVQKVEEPSDDENAYQAWNSLRLLGSGTYFLTGAGARVAFERMERKGIDFPVVVYDLCSALEKAM